MWNMALFAKSVVTTGRLILSTTATDNEEDGDSQVY